MNSLTREKGDTKEFRWLVLCSFGKERREAQKEFRQLVLGAFFLAKGEEMNRMNNTSFQGLQNQIALESFWYKEEEEVQRDSRLVKDCNRLIGLIERFFLNAKQSLAFIDSSCLVKSCVSVSFFPTLLLSAVHLISAFTFC